MFIFPARALVRRTALGVGAAISLALPAAAITGPAAVAHAAGSSPIPAIRQALKGVTSYRADGSLVGTGSAITQLSIISVHKGNVAQVHATITQPSSSGSATAYSEIIVVGPRYCARQGAHARFVCKTDAATASSVAKQLDLLASFNTSAAAADSYAPTASKTIGGQACDGYTIIKRSTKQSTGTLYVAHGSNLPCQIVSKSANGSGSNNGAITFSHYNDPSLTVGTVK